MVFVWLAVAVFYAAVLLVGLGVMAVASGSSVLLAVRRQRSPYLWRSQLIVTLLLTVAGTAAVAVALTWFGWVGGDVLAAAFASR